MIATRHSGRSLRQCRAQAPAARSSASVSSNSRSLTLPAGAGAGAVATLTPASRHAETIAAIIGGVRSKPASVTEAGRATLLWLMRSNAIVPSAASSAQCSRSRMLR